MTAPSADLEKYDYAGTWRIYAKRPGHPAKEVTFFRDAPTGYGAWTLADPYGPQAATLTFPKITMWDSIGHGDLEWLSHGTDFDIVWEGEYPPGYEQVYGSFAWEGYAESFDYSTESGLSVSLKGALMQLDNYLAKPEYPARPIPYEYAIRRQFSGKPDLRLKPLRLEWPTDWGLKYEAAPKGTRSYLIPAYVVPGQNWSGLTTRQTGSWDQALTSYIQTLLSSWYTEKGRFTLELQRHRQPVLKLREYKNVVDESVLVIDPATPGVSVTLSQDYSQSLNVAYGQGSSLAGEGYSGQVVSGDGERTTYRPLAATRQVEPLSDKNGWLDLSVMRKEVNLSLQQGLSQQQARQVALSHLKRFTEPGVTGTITLTVDPKLDCNYLPRFLIKAGMSIYLPRAMGVGVLLHISQVDANLADGTVNLTVDSKYRGALEVSEVMLRGRDSLQVARQLIGGLYQNAVPDLLQPWNYREGSGYIPSGPVYNSQRLFEGMPLDMEFPWTEMTVQRPPKNKSWRKCYMGIPPKNANADFNWGTTFTETGSRRGFPIKMAQAGDIRLLQIVAVDEDGVLMPVRFHFSLYTNNGVSYKAMPRLKQADLVDAPGYRPGQRYPFFRGAWERIRPNGTTIQDEDPISVSSAGFQRGWGTYYVPAGYWPGQAAAGDPKTGLLVDEGNWSFDTTNDPNFSQFTPQQLSQNTGYLYGMIYCDDQGDQPVYFVGRMFRVEPGSSV